MKLLIVIVALFAMALAAPPQQAVEIVSLDSEVGPESYSYAFETSDGTAAQQQGKLLNVGSENEAISVSGSYQFIGDDGITYAVKYIADENGFQPEGAHLPVGAQV